MNTHTNPRYSRTTSTAVVWRTEQVTQPSSLQLLGLRPTVIYSVFFTISLQSSNHYSVLHLFISFFREAERKREHKQGSNRKEQGGERGMTINKSSFP